MKIGKLRRKVLSIINDYIEELKDSKMGTEQDIGIDDDISFLKSEKKKINEDLLLFEHGRAYQIAYLQPDDARDIRYDHKLKYNIIHHPNVEYYELIDFINAFNDDQISDLGYITIV